MSNCKERKLAFEYKIFNSCDELNQAWADLVPNDHFLVKSHLKVYELSQLPDIDFRYALIYWNQQPIAACYFQLLHLREYHLAQSAMKPWQQSLWQLFTQFYQPKLLVSGHLFRHDICSFYWQSDLSLFDVFKLYQNVLKYVMKATKAHAVLVKDVAPSMMPYFQHYATDCQLLSNDISMEMKIPTEWTEMNHYEKALKHKYAQRYRKVKTAWKDITIDNLSVEEVKHNAATIYSLYQQVSNRQMVRLGQLSPDFLPQLKAAFPDQLQIWIAKEEGRPIAFFSAWIHEDNFDMFYIGFDYEQNDRLQTYFNILFFSIEQAIQTKKQKLILGRTALEAKARLGCQPHYLSTYLYIRNSWQRKLFKWLQQRLSTEEGSWENRHPFKK